MSSASIFLMLNLSKLFLVALLVVILEVINFYKKDINNFINGKSINVVSLDNDNIPDCGENNYAIVDNNIPKFDEGVYELSLIFSDLSGNETKSVINYYAKSSFIPVEGATVTGQ